MNEPKMTKTQIINYIAGYYTSENRATNYRTGGCFLEIEGRYCAFSLCMHDQGREQMKVEKLALPSEAERVFGNVDAVLKPEFCGHSVGFWFDAQHFHDQRRYWNQTGLSKDGAKYRDELIVRWELIDKQAEEDNKRFEWQKANAVELTRF